MFCEIYRDMGKFAVSLSIQVFLIAVTVRIGSDTVWFGPYQLSSSD